MSPFVSCVMATRNRPALFRQALRYFLRQTHAHSELIVVDDGDEPVEELCQGLFRVRYVRAAPPVSLGAKLNLGIEHSRGELIQKLDDDDFYHARFLETAVAHAGDAELVAWDCFLVLLAGDSRLRFSGHGWTAGGTLCFHRSVWRRHPFRDVPRAVDYHFLADNPVRPRRVCAPELYMLVRHGANTWRTMRGGEVDEQFRQMPVYHKPLNAVVEPLDAPVYQRLCESAT